VQLHFSGDGKRKVKVGYVIEAPIWKTSYRLVLDKEGKPYLQGWAIVENPTDEDWSTVKMALVSGRPISFKMDLYNPLYIQRPTVEPELFASLRPQAYDGGFRNVEDKLAMDRLQEKPKSEPSRRGLVEREQKLEQLELQSEMDGMKKTYPRGATEASRDFAKQLGERMDLGSVASSATASMLGDFFQYVIDHPVNLGRQKSALLPIVGKDIEGTRISLYNPGVQVKHPLLGLRFKNTTGVHLSQGPVTVFEGSTYAGDARILDVTPNDERLITYAVDLGTEVIPQNLNGSSLITGVKAVKGIVHVTRRNREEKVYKISNKSDTDRTLLIEHPNRTNQQFKLVDSAKPVEELANVYRFETKVEAGKSAEYKVVEERDLGEQISLSNAPDDTIKFVMNLSEASPALKAKLTEALKVKQTWDGVRLELQQVNADVQRITADQDRIRKNLRETPKEAEVYQDYLKKLSAQEKEMDKLTDKQKQLMAQESEARKSFDNFLINLND